VSSESGGLSPLVKVALIAALVYAFATRSQSPVAPDAVVVPDDKPSAVSVEIKTALKDSPKGTAMGYAAFYDACAATLETDSAPVAKLRARMERAKALLKLSAPEAFGNIVVRELGAFDEGAIDKTVYAAAFRKLAVDCRRAEQ
jgi:hypothetical protein